MSITWIKCSERMPPDDCYSVITKSSKGYIGRISATWPVNQTITLMHLCEYWMPYDEKTWKELTKNG